MLRFLTLILIMTLSSCGKNTSGNHKGQNSTNLQSGGITSAGDPTSPVIVSGELIHQRGVPYTYDHDFHFTGVSHAVVQLVYYVGEDSPAKVIKEIRFSHVTALPLAFSITVDSSTGPIESIFENEGTYAIQASVHSKLGDDVQVGDLINETSTVVKEPTTGLKVFVTGVEACDAENAGGFCTSNE